MTVEELMSKLRRLIQIGRINEDAVISIRDLSVSQYAMDAGSSGYIELDEVLVVSADDVRFGVAE